MSGYVQTNQIVKLVADGVPDVYQVSEADSGKILMIPPLGGAGANTLDITLPTLKAGLKYKFIASGLLASAATIAPGPAANIVTGTIYNLNAGAATATAKAGAGNVQLTANAEGGDFVELFCDGTLWYVNGSSRVAAGLA